MAKLREPHGFFQKTIRDLAVAAMDVTHHDAQEPEYTNEMQSLERRFTSILRGKLIHRSAPSTGAQDSAPQAEA